MKRALIVVAVLLVLVLLAEGLVFGRMLMEGSSAYERSRESLERDRARFAEAVLADHRRWSGDPLLSARDGGDASPLLLQHLGYEILPPAPGAVPAALRAAIVDAGADWAHRSFDVAAVDTSWMAGLASYGYWDIEADGTPLEAFPFDLAKEPLPSFVQAQWHAKVRLLQGLERGDIGPAIEESNELARLCLSSESLLGEMVGVAVLSAANKAGVVADQRGLDAGTARRFSEEEIAALRRFRWAMGERSSLMSSSTATTQPPATCGAMRELGAALFVRPMSRHFVPERYRQLDAILQASPCRLRRLRAAWASENGEGELPQASALCAADHDDGLLCGASSAVLRLPLAKAAVGSRLVGLAEVDWYRLYRDAGVP